MEFQVKFPTMSHKDERVRSHIEYSTCVSIIFLVDVNNGCIMGLPMGLCLIILLVL